MVVQRCVISTILMQFFHWEGTVVVPFIILGFRNLICGKYEIFYEIYEFC